MPVQRLGICNLCAERGEGRVALLALALEGHLEA